MFPAWCSEFGSGGKFKSPSQRWSGATGVLQGHAIQKFHDDEWLPVVLADLIYRADVWVIERRSGLRLALKSSQGLRVVGDVVRQEF